MGKGEKGKRPGMVAFIRGVSNFGKFCPACGQQEVQYAE